MLCRVLWKDWIQTTYAKCLLLLSCALGTWELFRLWAGDTVLWIQQLWIPTKGDNIIGTSAVKTCLWLIPSLGVILCFPVPGSEYQLNEERKFNAEEVQDTAPF